MSIPADLVKTLSVAHELRVRMAKNGKVVIGFLHPNSAEPGLISNSGVELELARVMCSAFVASLDIPDSEQMAIIGKIAEAEISKLLETMEMFAKQNLKIGSPLTLLWNLKKNDGKSHPVLDVVRELFLTPATPVTRLMLYPDSKSIQVYIRRTRRLNWGEMVAGLLRKRAVAMEDSGLSVERHYDKPQMDLFAVNLFQLIMASLGDGFNVLIVGPTGVGKTTVQISLVFDLIRHMQQKPIVVLDTYPELEVFMDEIWKVGGMMSFSFYYCLANESVRKTVDDLLQVITSGNVGLLVIQEASSQSEDLPHELIPRVITSGVPYVMTAFAETPSIILPGDVTAIGIHILNSLNYRLYGNQKRLGKACLIIPVPLQIYYVDTNGTGVYHALRALPNRNNAYPYIPDFEILPPNIAIPDGNIAKFQNAIHGR